MAISRRVMLGGALASAVPLPSRLADPFTLGVASGDPLPDAVVLWTRLAPRPLDGGGMPDRTVPVAWEVAADERFRHVVRRGVAEARPARVSVARKPFWSGQVRWPTRRWRR